MPSNIDMTVKEIYDIIKAIDEDKKEPLTVVTKITSSPEDNLVSGGLVYVEIGEGDNKKTFNYFEKTLDPNETGNDVMTDIVCRANWLKSYLWNHAYSIHSKNILGDKTRIHEFSAASTIPEDELLVYVVAAEARRKQAEGGNPWNVQTTTKIAQVPLNDDNTRVMSKYVTRREDPFNVRAEGDRRDIYEIINPAGYLERNPEAVLKFIKMSKSEFYSETIHGTLKELRESVGSNHSKCRTTLRQEPTQYHTDRLEGLKTRGK